MVLKGLFWRGFGRLVKSSLDSEARVLAYEAFLFGKIEL